ncbi:MAG: cytidylate kinase-like family protein [Planctomycetaceae bacterium]|nr:MAG: cytidylate kinase-like family protein [Planctomycetaceae bacterium]
MNVRSQSSQSIKKLVEEQFRKWEMRNKEENKKKTPSPVITVSREPGSNGHLIAMELAKQLDLDLFDVNIINEVAKSAKMSERVVKTLDEKGRSLLDELVNSLDKERHLWDHQYMDHLTKIIGTIGKHGRAVILGRGANFILSTDTALKVRIIAPQEVKINNVASELDISTEEAKLRIMNVESEREAFIKKYFGANGSDPMYYDLVLNMANLTVESALDIIKTALHLRMSAK